MLLGILILSVIASSTVIVHAADSTWPAFNSCCEKTINGAWCQNTVEGDCDNSIDPITKSPYRKTPTSCDATSFCKLGCCVDSGEGLCMENSPQKVCEISEGTWLEDPQCNVAQCKLGCCLLGDQASFVTLTRCKRLSALYGLTTNFKKDITNEAKCIMMAYSQDRGACVYEVESDRTCKLTTRADCDNMAKKEGGENGTITTEFFKDYLCSADELATNCGPTTETTCIPGKDEVYFKDSCGNPANIYDASKTYTKDKSYWQKIVPKSSSCSSKSKTGSAGSKTCGNCDYLSGSICGKGSATYGEYMCKDVNCYNTMNGNSYKNGESWCSYQGEVGGGRDTVGSRQFRHVCIHGEETIEPCADYRNEICIQQSLDTSYGSFTEAACRPNRWKDCIDQSKEKDCMNKDKRDCYWVLGYAYDGSGKSAANATAATSTTTTTNQNQGIINGTGICLPNYPPGLKFWENGDAAPVCSLGNSKQIVTYETNFFGTKTCVDNCDVITTKWAQDMNVICNSLGDCGAKMNVVGRYTEDGYLWKSNGQSLSIQTGVEGEATTTE